MKTLWVKWRPASVVIVLLLLIYIIFRGTKEHSCSLTYVTDPIVDHVREYCNSPTKTVHGQEGEVTTMKDGSKLTLLSVHTFIRHGDRNNLHTIPNYESLILSCKISEDLMEELPLVRDYMASMKENAERSPRRPTQTFHGWDTHPNKEKCDPGLLTPIGVAQHVMNGHFFKQKYSTKHHLFGSTEIEKSVLVRATDKSRTYQSAVALLFGFLPKLELSKLEFQMATNASLCTSDTGHPCSCKSADPYGDVMSATYMQTSPKVRKSVKAERMYGALAKVFDSPATELPRPSHLMDISMVHFCHSEHLPGARGVCMPNWAVRDIYDIMAENGANQAKGGDFIRIARLKMQPVLHEMADRMILQGSGDTPVKFVLYSGHDSTIDPLAVALNFTTGLWSPYASRVVFELYRGEATGKDMVNMPLYIRVLFNGELVTSKLPFCSKSITDHNLGLCPLDQFVKFVRKDNLHQLGESHYGVACSKPIGVIPG